MRKSCYIINGISLAFLAATIFSSAVHAQRAASRPSQPSDIAVASTDASGASAGATTPEITTLASPQTPATTATASGTNAPAGSADELHDNTLHIYGTAYLWVPTMHGTVGLRGYDTNIHVTTGEIFSNFRGGFLGVFTPTYNRWSAPVDVLWMRLRSSKPVPSEDYPGYALRATLNESIITPKLNYLAFDNPKIKIYGTAGARIWHIGTTLSLIPVVNGTFPYRGVTWIDYVMGARFSVPLGKKASVDILGDGGEGGATLDYQVGGIVNYQLKPKLTAQVGWRYLTEHYGNDGNIMNTTTQGVVFGATYQFK
jgi:hypothetical protein